MKKMFALLLISVILLTGGTGAAAADTVLPVDVSIGLPLKKSPDLRPPEPLSEIIGDLDVLPRKYLPEKNLTIQETVEAFFEQQYNSYLELKYTNVDSIVNMKKHGNKNMVKWLRMTVMRRKLILENDLGYVSTERLPYKIVFNEEPTDNRMGLWRDYLSKTNETVVHFYISGKKGEVYPPFMAVNSQHSMFFKKIDGVWKIQMHYFPGSSRTFSDIGPIPMPTEGKMLSDLKKEFTGVKSPKPPELPDDVRQYDPKKAVRYAMMFTEKPNSQFYRLGDWIGDCMNFVSQCVWAGFDGGDSMTTNWRVGTAAWANVNNFWHYITGSHGGLHGQQLSGINALRPGDIIQSRTASVRSEPQRYRHVYILVDDEKLILAQNTPSAFVYYSDLSNRDLRFVRPTYMKR